MISSRWSSCAAEGTTECNYFSNVMRHTPNTVVEELAILLHIRKALGSNIDTNTGYSDIVFCDFGQYFQANARIVLDGD
jgi:hypothetical protein